MHSPYGMVITRRSESGTVKGLAECKVSLRVYCTIILFYLHIFLLFIYNRSTSFNPHFFIIFFPPIFSFILQILSSVVFCLLLGREGKKPKPKEANERKNLVRKILKGFIMSQCFQFTLHVSLSPEGVNSAY